MNTQRHQHPYGGSQQATGNNLPDSQSGDNSDSSLADTPQTSICGDVFCLYHWHEEPEHDPNARRVALHSQIELGLHKWVQSTLNAKIDLAEQQRLHRNDLTSLWFGLDVGNGSTAASFITTDVYENLMKSSTFPDKAQQFPSVVSFVGPTGAGKSTLIKGLINLANDEGPLPTPISGSNFVTGAPTSSDVHLYVDPSTLHSEYPILLVDCEGLGAEHQAPSAMDAFNGRGLCEVLQETSIAVKARDFRLSDSNGARPTRKFCLEDLYPRMLYAFSDVICFVTDSSNGAEGTIGRLIEWADQVLTKTINQPSLPRVIVVCNAAKNDPAGWLDESVATDTMLERVRNVPLVDPKMRKIAQTWRNRLSTGRQLTSIFDLLQLYFKDIFVVYIPSEGKYPTDIIYKQYQKLRHRIQEEVERIQTEKEQSENRFPTIELARLFKAAFEHFSHNFNKPFDFFESSRNNKRQLEAFDQHAQDLMKRIQKFYRNAQAADRQMSVILASYISLATLEGNIFRFPTERVLEDYQQLCKSAYKSYYDSAPCAYVKDGKKCVNMQRSHEKGHQDQSGVIFDQGDFVAAYNKVNLQIFWSNICASYSQVVAELRHLKAYPDDYKSEILKRHRGALSHEKRFWESVTSHLTCFVCLSHHPDNVLPCQHALCESCIKQFGVRDRSDGSVFKLEECPLCQAKLGFRDTTLSIQLKPENAGVRILCLDGGGVRSIISSKIIEILENETGLDIPIHEFFDLIVGNGTGGVVALSLARNRWSAQDCIEMFKKFTVNSFRPHSLFDIRILREDKGIFRAKDLEAQLQQVFKNKDVRLLFGDDFTGPFSANRERSRALKVAVTATTTVDSELHLITNYNRKKETSSPAMHREHNPKYEMEVWEAARCTSAAPPMFHSYEAKSGDCFQNDGLKHINPAKIGTVEAPLIWPGSSQLDYLVTLGTGFIEKNRNPAPPGGILGWIAFNLLESFNFFFDTEIIWEQYKQNIDPEQISRYHRFNFGISPQKFVDRDQTSAIKNLEVETSEAFNRGKPERRRLKKTANCLIAALFYADIESISRTSEHSYSINAVLVCRFEQRYHANVVTALLKRNSYFLVGDKRTDISIQWLEIVRSGGFFSIPVNYVVTELTDRTDVFLAMDAVTPLSQSGIGYHVSGSPFTHERYQHLARDSFT